MTHNAIVAKIESVSDIVGADNIHLAKVLGENVVVSKEWGVGFIGLFFQADLQLSDEFCSNNNLYRDSEKNLDKTKKGFFDKNRRIRAQPFLGVKSEAFFSNIDCIAYTGKDCSSLTVGEQFSELNGHLICEKYISEASKAIGVGNKEKQKKKKNSVLFFDKHVDSDNFKHYCGNIEKGSLLSFHAKVHGTSARMGLLPVETNLPKWKMVINTITNVFFGKSVFISKTEWKYVVGTRNVVLNDNDTDKQGFHGAEQFRFDILESLKPHLSKGMTIYGEISGYANGKPIMPPHSVKSLKNKDFVKKYGDSINYSYGCSTGEYRFHVYRITQLCSDNEKMEYSQSQLENWCAEHGFNSTFKVHDSFVFDGNTESLVSLVEKLTERPDVLCEDYIDKSHVSEGIIIRVDNGSSAPKFYKSKSYAFRVMEGMCEAEDIESAS